VSNNTPSAYFIAQLLSSGGVKQHDFGVKKHAAAELGATLKKKSLAGCYT